MTPFRAKLAILTMLGVLVIGFVLDQAGAFDPVPSALYDLYSVNDSQVQFNQDVGKPRLILLLSPT